jgi:CheY-like chemotaxis protein
VKFTTHGEVTIEVIAGATPDELRITVADTGIGIPPERLSVLFQPFTQVDSSMARRFGGTGLGLAICRQLVERMGGSIEVGSVPGQGTRFTLALRLPAGSGAESVTHHALTGRRVLMCGPPTGSQRAVTTYLAALGCEVTHALTPAASALGEIDLVVFDEAQAEIVSTALRRQSTASGPARLRLTNFKSSLGERAAVDPREQMISRPVQFHKLQQALARAFSPALPTVPAGDKAVTARAQPLHGARVLLVEDNGVNQALALGMLEAYDVAVSCAESGVEALAQLGTAPFDLVLMDCQMPEMDGLEATRRWRAIEAGSGARRVPIVALTANAMAGMDAYLAKPFTRAELTEVLRTWLVLPARTHDDGQGPPSPGTGSTASRTCTDEFDEGVELSLLS